MTATKIHQIVFTIFIVCFSFTIAYSQDTQVYYYQNTKPIAVTETILLNSKKDSIRQGFYSNDTLAYSYKIHNNKPSGIYKVYYLNGILKYRGVFMNGLLNGSWKEFNNTGNLIVTGQYLFGKKDGSWFYFEDKKVEVFKNGISTGRCRTDEGWTPRTLFVYKNGVLLRTKREYPKTKPF